MALADDMTPVLPGSLLAHARISGWVIGFYYPKQVFQASVLELDNVLRVRSVFDTQIVDEAETWYNIFVEQFVASLLYFGILLPVISILVSHWVLF